MENNFYTDEDFEHFLKDATYDFKMYPSKKVWYSVYNDLHPSRRWPSLAVCLLLITAILFVGISNNNSINSSTRIASLNKAATENIPSSIQNASAADNVAPQDKYASNYLPAYKYAHIPQSGNTADISQSDAPVTDRLINSDATVIHSEGLYSITVMPGSIGPIQVVGEKREDAAYAITKTAGRKNDHPGLDHKDISTDDGDQDGSLIPDKHTITLPNDSAMNIAAENDKALAKNNQIARLTTEEKSWIENYAFNNKAAKSRFKTNATIEYYVTPSVGFRTLRKNVDLETEVSRAAQNSLVAPNSAGHLDINDEVTQKSSLNMEAGIMIAYSVSKKFRIKTGLQYNYTSYISFADELQHPTQTYLTLTASDGSYETVPRLSNYSNSVTGDKKVQLNNKTIQLSLPIGADFRIAGKNRLKWYAGATIQPGLIIDGNVYAISDDTHNYINESSLLRKWTLSTGLETFLSYKMPSGIIVNMGPQARYQLPSTYTKKYSYTEKLYNLGLKLGITKTF